MSDASSTVIPNFLIASTPRALRRLMLLNNYRLGAWHKYDIQFVNNKWYAWYHEDIVRSKNTNDISLDPRVKDGVTE